MYDARAASNCLLEIADEKGISVSNLKLQKLLYLAHGLLLKTEDRPLVKGGFEAWDYGPVSRTAYQAFKKFENGPITEPAVRYNPRTRTSQEMPVEIDPGAVAAIERIVHVFGSWAEFDLVAYTHRANTPWSVTVNDARCSANVGMVIADETIIEHFEAFPEIERCSPHGKNQGRKTY